MQEVGRTQIVAEVAERAAAEIRERAEAEARRLAEERRRVSDAFLDDQRRALAELDRATMEHFGLVKATTEELLVTLRRTIARAGEPLPFDVPPAPQRAPAPVEAPPAAAPPAPVGPPSQQPLPTAVAPAAVQPPPVAAEPTAPEPPPAPAPDPLPVPAPDPLPEPRPAPAGEPAPPAEPVPPDDPAPDDVVATSSAPSKPAAPERKSFVHHSTEATALAARMAAAGSGRDDIIRGLREKFSISDPEPLADEALAHYGA